MVLQLTSWFLLTSHPFPFCRILLHKNLPSRKLISDYNFIMFPSCPSVKGVKGEVIRDMFVHCSALETLHHLLLFSEVLPFVLVWLLCFARRTPFEKSLSPLKRVSLVTVQMMQRWKMRYENICFEAKEILLRKSRDDNNGSISRGVCLRRDYFGHGLMITEWIMILFAGFMTNSHSQICYTCNEGSSEKVVCVNNKWLSEKHFIRELWIWKWCHCWLRLTPAKRAETKRFCKPILVLWMTMRKCLIF